MAENLLNVNLYTSKNSEQTSTLKKAYVDSSFNFDKAYDNASKTYNNEKKFSDVSTAPKYADRSADNSLYKEDFNKVAEKKSYEDSSAIKEKEEFNTHKEESSKKTDDADDSRDSKDSSKSDDAENEKSSDDNQGNKENSQSVVQEKTPATITAETLVSQAVSLLAKINGTEESQQAVASESADKASATAQQALSTGKPGEKLEVDSTKLTQDPKDIVAAKNLKAKVQSEVQQVLLNLKVEPEAKSLQAKSDVAVDIADVKTQAPLIQASADVVAKAVAGPSAKKVLISEMLEKAVLNQDILDKTNAQVVSVETSSSSGNLLNQQNAKEHGVKMSLETNINTNVSNVANPSTQVNFDKKIEVAQAPKELSKTDILSQIHTKLDGLKEEGTTKITIVLKPENLGKINLELINSKDGFTARMTTENAQVKELLDKNLDSLKSSLASQGVNVGNVTVKVAEVEKQSNEMFSFDQKQPQSGEQQSSAGSNGSNNSNNSYGSRNSQGYFEEEIVNQATSTVSGESDSRIVHDGQIDYKI